MSDWTTDAADLIENVTLTIRERTVEPAQAITRAVVFGILALLIATPALMMATIATFRGLVVIYEYFGIGVWAAWLTLGGIFIALGALVWAVRKP